MITVHDLRHVSPDVVEAWADHVAENLRDQDRDELKAGSQLEPHDALRTSIGMSTHAYAILDRDNVPVALFGAAPHPLPGVGVVWLLGTDGILREALSIARQSRPVKDALQEVYPVLWNYIDERNTVSMRWLKWCGYRLYGQVVTETGHPFRIFARTAHV